MLKNIDIWKKKKKRKYTKTLTTTTLANNTKYN